MNPPWLSLLRLLPHSLGAAAVQRLELIMGGMLARSHSLSRNYDDLLGTGDCSAERGGREGDCLLTVRSKYLNETNGDDETKRQVRR
jgi:hypothetical protein